MTGAPHRGDVPIDLNGVADVCHVTYSTAKTGRWQRRHGLPDPDGRIGSANVWWKSKIYRWWVSRHATLEGADR